MLWSRFESRLGIVVVHHPLYTEGVGTHPKVGAPKGIGNGHTDVAASRKAIEQAIGLCFAFCGDGDVEKVALYPGRESGRAVAAHQYAACRTNRQRNVQNFFGLLLGHGCFRGRHVPKSGEHAELAAKNGFVVLKGCFTMAIEV